jgi:hypothetical protein
LVKNLLSRPFFIRLFNWEFWSFGAVYIWTLPAWIYFCLRAKSFFFFTTSNPSIINGGLIGESKKDIHAILPPDLYPKTLHFDQGTDGKVVLKLVLQSNMTLPLIGKPDIGGKGRGVKMLKTEKDIIDYANSATLHFHVQQYISFSNEVGIFYYRFPDQDKGRITGIVEKKFLTVTGNGKDTLQQLLRKDKRGIMYIDSLEKIHADILEIVLPAGEKKIVSPYGNHARGALFLDHSFEIDEELTALMDTISKRIPEFYFGRFDIRYNSMEKLKRGKDFSIIELNGAGAEPTHIYDPRHSIFFAWKEIIRHWNILEKISRMNHKRGYPYPRLKEGLAIFAKDKADSEKLAKMSI